ncbi:MAG TPA: GspH/FimT family protein [Trueperaceae bacterium]|nr:GspH/FimT family protein [Trueperaceae bacterium]
MRSDRQSGFTLIELLVCLAVIGSVAGIGLSFARPANDLRAATALKSLLLWSRSEAMWQGSSVSVTELPLGTGYQVRRLSAGSSDCHSGEVISRLLLVEHAGVSLAGGFGSREGLLWLPTGSGRSCDGGGVISATITLQSLTSSSRVIVSSMGRVRVERMP